MSYYLSHRAQDELCEELIKDYAGLYYPYKEVDIIGFAKSLGLDLRYVKFCDHVEGRLGFYADGKTPVYVMTKKGPKEMTFPKNTVLIDISLMPEEKLNKRRFTLAHEVYHHIESMLGEDLPSASFSTELDLGSRCSVSDLKKVMNVREMVADRGAAALLMPSKLVKNTMLTIMRGKPICIYGDNIIPNCTVEKLREMANFMQVSLTALIIRLKHLRLLEKHDVSELTCNIEMNREDEYDK